MPSPVFAGCRCNPEVCLLFNLQADLANLYLKAGVKNIGTVFLMTDMQVADEQFLVLVNDFLASGKSCAAFISPLPFFKVDLLVVVSSTLEYAEGQYMKQVESNSRVELTLRSPQ